MHNFSTKNVMITLVYYKKAVYVKKKRPANLDVAHFRFWSYSRVSISARAGGT